LRESAERDSLQSISPALCHLRGIPQISPQLCHGYSGTHAIGGNAKRTHLDRLNEEEGAAVISGVAGARCSSD
jgi:hypothetical protein